MLMVPITIIMTIVIASIQYFHVHVNPVFQLSGTMAFFHFHLLPTAATFCFKICCCLCRRVAWKIGGTIAVNLEGNLSRL